MTMEVIYSYPLAANSCDVINREDASRRRRRRNSRGDSDDDAYDHIKHIVRSI